MPIGTRYRRAGSASSMRSGAGLPRGPRGWIRSTPRSRAETATSRCFAGSRKSLRSPLGWRLLPKRASMPRSSVNAIPDLAQRARALDPTGSFIVQAPAGSGKTELLIQRFLVLLARVARPEESAALTFTRKAAAEMRKRIFEALRSARHAPRPSEAHEARTWDLAAAVLQKNDAHGWKIEESATRVRIQTIDSLCASLTRQMPVLAKFGAQPESLDDASALYLEAARA